MTRPHPGPLPEGEGIECGPRLEGDGIRRVVKLGGSLLDFPYLVPRLRQWLERQPRCATVIVAGGGRMADAIRDADHLHRLGESVSHWLCIRVMTIQAELLGALLPEATICRSLAEWRLLQSELTILDPWIFLREEEPGLSGHMLPESWDVTSDSIAARFASAIGAAELVLLKSALPEPASTLSDASAAGYVDAFLPRLADCIPAVRCVNLRAAEFTQTIWQCSP